MMYSLVEEFEDRMTKAELIKRLAEDKPHLYLNDVHRIVDNIFKEISNALANGDRVEIRGFGSFTVKNHSAHIGRNPSTGAAVNIPEKLFPVFRSGKLLRDRLNGRA